MNSPISSQPGMIPPGGKQIQLSEDQLLHIIVNDLVASQIKSKEMLLTHSHADYEEATSNWINDRKYGLRHIKNEQKIIFDLWVPVPGQTEPQHREMLAAYKDILGTMIQNRLSTPMQAADAMYDVMNQYTVDEWENIITKINKKSNIII